LDKNGDGSLTLEELRTGLSDIKNGEEILALMQAADTDHSGTINYTGNFHQSNFEIDSNLTFRIHCCNY
jgi:Ca2+-binding EF-hand superfamily protein